MNVVTKLTGLALVALLASPTLAASPPAVGDRGGTCERAWWSESADWAQRSPGDPAALVNRWQGHAESCSGTVVYEARLATALALAGRIEDARTVLKPLPRTSRYAHIVEFAALACDQIELLASARMTEQDVRGLERRYRNLVRRHPGFADAHGMLGGMQSMLGKHAEAVVSLERGLRTPVNTAGVNRHLAVSLAALGRYAEAMAAADRAVRMNRALTSDHYFMIAVATANTELGDLESAEMALKLILAKQPDMQSDPEFVKAVQIFKKRAAERERSGQPASPVSR